MAAKRTRDWLTDRAREQDRFALILLPDQLADMRVYLLRHAEAVPGTPDASRDLTAHGQRQVALLAKGAGQVPLEEVDAIEHSPLVRAVRTAQLLRLATGSPLPLKVLGGLEPEHDPRKTAELLAKSRRSRLLVGHNPHLAELTALLLGLADGGAAVRFRKSGLLALERTAKPTRLRPYGSWSLLWMIPPDLAK
jgi:phosphohistidine phosphatase